MHFHQDFATADQTSGDKPAQGNALESLLHEAPSLAGRNKRTELRIALSPFQGFASSLSIPMALPWAGLWMHRWCYGEITTQSA